MKIFQKTNQLVVISLLCGGIFLAVNSMQIPKPLIPKGLTKSRAISSIRNAHEKVFVTNDLFAEENKQTDVWKRMIKGLQPFIDKNAYGNKELLKVFSLCEDVSNQIIGILRRPYIVLSPDMQARARFASPRSQVERLNKSKIGLEIMSSALKDTSYGARGQEGAKTVLLFLIEKLGTTIDQLSRDFEKRM